MSLYLILFQLMNNNCFKEYTASIASVIEEKQKPRFLRSVLNKENPRVIIELTEERVNLVDFVEYVLNFEKDNGGK